MQQITIHTELLRQEGPTVAIMFGYIMGKSASDVTGWHRMVSHEVAAEIGMSKAKQLKARKRLIEMGLIRQKNKGLPVKLYVALSEQVINALVTVKREAVEG